MLLLLSICNRQSYRVPLLLAAHTCSTIFISALLLASMTGASLFGYMNIALEQHGNTIWCRWRGFFIHGFLCALYDSYVLQAAYRLCRVVFYRRKNLHRFSLYLCLVPVQSVFAVISISPVLIHGDVIYLQSEYYCQTPFTNIPAITYIALRLFLLPIILIALIYIYLVKYVRRPRSVSIISNDNHHLRSKQNTRDLIVIRRLLLILSTLMFLGLPSTIFLIILMITGHLISVTYRIGWFCVSVSLIFLAYMLMEMTDSLKKTARELVERSSHRHTSRKPSSERQISL